MLTKKDLEIINQALAQYEALMDDGYDEFANHAVGNPIYDNHKKTFGNPEKTINATRGRIFQEIAKRNAVGI
jgi:hypothetical protein